MKSSKKWVSRYSQENSAYQIYQRDWFLSRCLSGTGFSILVPFSNLSCMFKPQRHLCLPIVTLRSLLIIYRRSFDTTITFTKGAQCSCKMSRNPHILLHIWFYRTQQLEQRVLSWRIDIVNYLLNASNYYSHWSMFQTAKFPVNWLKLL